MPTNAPRSPDVRTWIFLGALVAALVGVIAWSLGPQLQEPGEPERDASIERSDGAIDYATSPLLAVHPPREAACEFAVVTDRREEDLGPLTDRKALGALLLPRHCGNACDRVRELVANRAHFETEVIKATDYILPPEDAWTTIAPSLDASDRARLHAMPNVVVIKTHHPIGRGQWAARVGFAVTSALTEALGGYVYDETLRRIETASTFASHALTESDAENPLRTDRYVVQSYREASGTLRFVTLGLLRFGAFDFEVKDISPRRATEAALLIARTAKLLALGQRWPFALPTERTDGGAGARFDFIEGIPTEGDPDTLGGRLLPLEASWDAAFDKLFGAPDSVLFDPNDPHLAEIAKRMREKLPRFEAARARGSRLLVKFRWRTNKARSDAEVEELWMLASACSRTECNGYLRSAPTLQDDRRIGDPIRTPVSDVVDAILETPDGGREGGESESILRGVREHSP